VQTALGKSGLQHSDLAAVGITNQRETTFVWDRRTGRPLHNAIVWQDTRTDGIAAALDRDGLGDVIRQRAGLPPATYFAGGKLQWILDNKDKYNIRVVNISAGGDEEQSYLNDPLSEKVEECSRAGITVVCAVGNAGHLPNHPVVPPASAPSCIAVGGLDDGNSINRARRGMYRSSYGPTVDGLQKPEVIAPSIWVPAPILPNTPTAQQAALLKLLDSANDEDLHTIIEEHAGVDGELDAANDRPVHSIRQIITLKLRRESLITQHYKYVDGTSFSAPIVSSLVAQMIEANPDLTPSQIKIILIKTAERLPHYEVDRQGWGVIDPRRAVEMALLLSGNS
jgi:serine protease AprX